MAKDKKWKDEFYVRGYQLAKEGKSDTMIAKLLGVSLALYKKWLDKNGTFNKAINDGRSIKEGAESFRQYVFSRLPDNLQELWNKILRNKEDITDSPEEARKKQRERRGLFETVRTSRKEDRQQLYLYALINSNFTRTEACKKIGISPTCIAGWETKDRQFKELVKQVEEAKKDFYESALISLVRQGESNAVIFANRTYNRDRGYSDKVEMNISGNITHSVDELNLSLEIRKQILLAMREKETLALEDKSIEDAEFQEVK